MKGSSPSCSGAPQLIAACAADGPVEVHPSEDGLFFVAGEEGQGDAPCWDTECHLWFLPGDPGPASPAEPIAGPPTACCGPTPAAEIIAGFPETIDSHTERVRAVHGPDWLASYGRDDPADAAAITAIRGSLRSIDRMPRDRFVASALVPVTGRTPAITTVRVRGATTSDVVDAVIPFLFSDTVLPAPERRRIAGKEVIRITDSAIPWSFPRYIYPTRDVVWLVEADEEPRKLIIGSLP